MARKAPGPALLAAPAILALGALATMAMMELPPLQQAAMVGAAALLTAVSVALQFAGRSSAAWRRMRQILLAALVLTMPILRWNGPGNTAVPDAAIFAVVLFGVAALARRESVLPPRALVYCWLAYIGAGLISALGSSDIGRCLLTLTQDLFLLLFWIALYPILYARSDPIGVAWASRIWLLAATLSGLLVMVAPLGVGQASSLLTYRGWGIRGVGLFRDPNMAAHYLGLSVMLVPLARIPLRRWRRPLIAAAAGVLVLGLAVTGSNGAKVALAAAVLASALALVMGRAKRSFGLRGFLLAVTIAAVLLVVLTVGSWLLSPDAGPPLASGWRDAPEVLRLALISYTLDTRFVAWGAALDTFRDHPLGIGPGQLGRTPRSRADREAHSDILAALAERGLPGALALLCAVVVWLRLLLRDARVAAGTGGDDRTAIAARLGATVFLLVFGLSLDTLHFRHLWLALALLLPPAFTPQPPAAPDRLPSPPPRRPRGRRQIPS